MPVIEQEQELKQEALTVTQQAAMVRIVDQNSYDAAASLLLERIIPFRKKWENYWKPLKEAAWAAHKGIMDKFNDGDRPAEQAERQVKSAIRIWDDEQARILQQKQREAQAAAEAKEREERLAAAVMAEDSGAKEDEVVAILEAPTTAVAAPVEPTYERSAGISGRDNWQAQVFDIKALCKAIAVGKIPADYVLPNQPILNARAKADRSTLNIAGVRAVNNRIISGRSR